MFLKSIKKKFTLEKIDKNFQFNYLALENP